MRKLELIMKEQIKYKITKRFVDNKFTNYKILSLQLNMSLKTACNYVKKYKLTGKSSYSHSNHNRNSSNIILKTLLFGILNQHSFYMALEIYL